MRKRTKTTNTPLNEILSEKWGQLRGLKVISIALGSVTLPEEDAEMIKQAQRTAIMKDPTMAAATLVGAQADAMKAAASNEAGAMTGFMGFGMAANAGGINNAHNLFAMGQEQQAAKQEQQAQQTPQAQEATPNMAKWICPNGHEASGKFCPECGSPKPVDNSWSCSCGTTNSGKFCSNCGSPKPEVNQVKQCSNCGWTAPDSGVTPKFCPECGKAF